MVKTFKANSVDERPHPTQQYEVPTPITQKEIVIDKIKESREHYEKMSLDMR